MGPKTEWEEVYDAHNLSFYYKETQSNRKIFLTLLPLYLKIGLSSTVPKY